MTSDVIGATRTDWSAFSERGGKIIWLHGNDEPKCKPVGNAKLFESVVARMGADKVKNSCASILYPVWLMAAVVFSPTWDNLAALDNWVEHVCPRPIQSLLTQQNLRPKAVADHCANIQAGQNIKAMATSRALQASTAPMTDGSGNQHSRKFLGEL